MGGGGSGILGEKREQKRNWKITKEKRVRQQTEDGLRLSVMFPKMRLSGN